MLASFCGIFLSRVFGLLRDILFARFWGGTGTSQAAFNLAFSIPNMFRGLFGEGAFTAAFVPAISQKLEAGDREGAWRLAERTISLQGIALLALVAVSSLVSLLLLAVTPAEARPHIGLTFRILPLLMPYALLICLAGSFGSILNALRSFLLPSVNPILFNLCQIGAILLLGMYWGNEDLTALYLFCGSVLLAGVLQMATLMYACYRQGFHFHFRVDLHDSEVRSVLSRFVPGAIGAGTSQLNQFLDKVLVGWLGAKAISALTFSQHLVYVPVGVFGVAIGNVCLTDISRAVARQDDLETSECLDFGLRQVLFLSLPCAVLFGVLSHQVIGLLFEHGAYTAEATRECVWALCFYLPGLPAFCMHKVASVPHHASGDTTTPVRISMGCIALNLVLNLALIMPLRQGGLALATSICSWVNVLILLQLARRRARLWQVWRTARAGLGLLTAAGVAGVLAWHALSWMPVPQETPAILNRLCDSRTLGNVLRLAGGGLAGAIGYLLACLLLRRPEPRELFSAIRSRRQSR
ncbi:MAG: murein biosynthesis integral membrane protein MurJ [Victivallales bacterium]|nr:murein biosynthesis integral membrane protein MurJ [Victivallales bacterium]